MDLAIASPQLELDHNLRPATEDPLAVYGERLAVARASRAASLRTEYAQLTLGLVRLRTRAKGM